MGHICKAKNLARSFELLKIILDLKIHADEKTSFGLCIQLALKTNAPNKEIICMIYDQIQDNKEGVVKCIGLSLTERIQDFHNN